MVENFTTYDWDFMKVNPRASYHVEGWKVKVRPSGEKYKAPIFEDTPIKTASDWKRIRPLEPDSGALDEQLRALQLINHSIGFDAYFVQTIFCPLGVAKYLAGNKIEPVQYTIREDRAAMHAALRVITETFINYAIACMGEGASGIFYATNGWASEGMLTPDQYREFGEQYDLEFLDAIKSRSRFNILHNCGSHIYFDLLETYPVQAISWAATLEGNPDLREGKMRSGKAVMGGISEKTVLKDGSPDQVQEEVEKALELTGGRHFLLAPGCSIPPETPAVNLRAIRRSLS
jgi:uroporphyrinogen decarboxylase